jgi:hypothetical protein
MVKVKAFIGGRINGVFVRKSALRGHNNIYAGDFQSRAISAKASSSTSDLLPCLNICLVFLPCLAIFVGMSRLAGVRDFGVQG